MLNLGSRKALLARLMCAANVPSLLIGARSLAKDLTILAYHRVFDLASAERDYSFDAELISASVADFTWQMQYVKRIFTPVTFQQIIDALKGGQPLPPRPIVVTFDDGFEDNYRYAYPILRDLKMPATFFLSTDYIGSQEVFWFDWVVHVFLCTKAKEIALAPLATTITLAADSDGRRRQATALLHQLKSLTDNDRRAVIAALTAHLGRESSEDLALSRNLTWDQVREMVAGGMEFGSHTASHPILTKVSDGALRAELVDSKRVIEQQLGRECRVLSYPDGAFDRQTMDAAAIAGYELAVAYFPGINKYHRLDRYALNRLHIERYTSRTYFEAMLAAPAVFMNY